MNCPTCGAENSEDALFCRECGSQLEEQESEPAAPEAGATTEEDVTLVSTSLADLLARESGSADETLPPPAQFNEEHTPPVVESSMPEPAETEGPESSMVSGGIPQASRQAAAGTVDAGKRGRSRQLMILIGGIMAVLLFCCCCSLLVGALLGSDPEVIEDIIDELSALPVYLPLI